MKISYICPTNCVRRPIAELAILLSLKGHEVSVAYPYSENCLTNHWAPNKKIMEDDNGVKNLHILSYYIPSLRYNITKPLSMLSNAREIFKADAVHLWEYWYPLSVFIIFYALFTGQRKKLIMTTDGLVGYSYKPKEPWWLVPVFKIYTKTIGKILFRIPGRLTTYGKAMLPFAEKAGMPMKKLIVQGTGIHLDQFEYVKKEVNKLKEEFSIKNDEKVLLFVGMLSERKGVKTVIEVGVRLLDAGLNVKVILVGNKHSQLPYKKLVPEKYYEKIFFAGGRSDIPSWMNLADCLLLPSEGEGLPGVVMEAMAARTACVATNEGCTPDLIESCVNGFLVEFGDVVGYAEAVKEVLKESKRYGEAAFEKIKEFDWNKVADEYLEIYIKE